MGDCLLGLEASRRLMVVAAFLGVWMHTSTLKSAMPFFLWIALHLYVPNLLAGLYIVVTTGVMSPVINTIMMIMIANEFSSNTCKTYFLINVIAITSVLKMGFSNFALYFI